MRGFCRLSLVAMLLAISCVTPAHARELKQHDMFLSIGGGFSNDSYTLGAQYGYFVLNCLMPGVRYFYTHEKGSIGDLDYTVDQHQANLFLRYYILTKGSVFPFVTADSGYLRYDQGGDALQERGLNLWSLFGGAGVVVFFSRNFAAEITAGWRQYFSVPEDLKNSNFDERPFEWNLGFGFYL